jgi:integration host factor subunit alpha
MGFGKKDIVKNISSKALISSKSSSLVLEAFLSFIKRNKSHKIKISKFGTYYLHKSPARIGRNPKTKIEAVISERNVVIFRPSMQLKNKINTD